MVTAFEAGTIQVANKPPLVDAARLKADPKYQVLMVTAGGTRFALFFNVLQPPTDNQHFRQAMLYALDRQRIVDTVLKGFGEMTGFDPLGQASPTQQAFNPYYSPVVSFSGFKSATLTQLANALQHEVDPVKQKQVYANWSDYVLDQAWASTIATSASLAASTPKLHDLQYTHLEMLEARDRFQEALQLIVKAWTEPQPFGWEGRFYQFRTVSIWPRPVQQPHPPVFMSGSTPESGEFAARLHLRLGLAFTTVPLAKASARYFREQAAAFGWHPAPDDVLYRTQVSVADRCPGCVGHLRVLRSRLQHPRLT